MADISKIKPNGASGDEYEIKDTTARTGVLHLNALTQSTKTVTGNPITVNDAAPINAEGLSMTVEPIQDLHGYDKPWVGGARKNKLRITLENLKARNAGGTWSDNVYTRYNATVTVNVDNGGNVKSFTINGTPNADFNFIYDLNDPLLVEGSSYILSGCPTGGSVSTYFQEYSNYTDRGYADLGNGVTFEEFAHTYQYRVVQVTIRSGYTIPTEGLTFYPMIRLATETDPTFAPYTNICPISGISTARVDDVGKNLLSVDRTKFPYSDLGITITVDDQNRIILNGTTTAGFIFPSPVLYANLEKNVDYRLSKNVESGTSNSGFILIGRVPNNTGYYSGNVGSEQIGGSLQSFAEFNFYFPNAGMSFTNYVCDFQVELGTTTTPYEPYQTAEAEIILGETVYGADIDYNTGKAVVDRVLIADTWGNYTDKSSLGNYTRGKLLPSFALLGYSSIPQYPQCNLAPYRAAWSDDSLHWYNNNTEIVMYLPNDTSNDTLVQCICYLATPYTLNLTPAQLKLLKGTNTLTCNGATITLKYQPDNVVGELKGEIRAVEAELAEAEENLEIVYEDHVANTSMGIIVDGYSVGDMPFSNALDIAKTGYIPIAVTDTSVVSSTVADQGEIATHCLLDVTNNRVRFYVHVMDSAASLTIPPNSLTFRVAYKKA